MKDQEKAVAILAVDDDVGILQFVRESLTSHFLCEVDTTPNPEYGFELALKRDYHLFLFDFLMPVIDGCVLYSLLTKVYLNHRPSPRPVPPLVLMSGYGEHARAQEFLREPGVHGLLSKPFPLDRLLTRVEQTVPRVVNMAPKLF